MIIIDRNPDKLKYLNSIELFYIYTDDDGCDCYVPFSDAVKYKTNKIKNKWINKIKSLFKTLFK